MSLHSLQKDGSRILKELNDLFQKVDHSHSYQIDQLTNKVLDVVGLSNLLVDVISDLADHVQEQQKQITLLTKTLSQLKNRFHQEVSQIRKNYQTMRQTVISVPKQTAKMFMNCYVMFQEEEDAWRKVLGKKLEQVWRQNSELSELVSYYSKGKEEATQEIQVLKTQFEKSKEKNHTFEKRLKLLEEECYEYKQSLDIALEYNRNMEHREKKLKEEREDFELKLKSVKETKQEVLRKHRQHNKRIQENVFNSIIPSFNEIKSKHLNTRQMMDQMTIAIRNQFEKHNKILSRILDRVNNENNLLSEKTKFIEQLKAKNHILEKKISNLSIDQKHRQFLYSQGFSGSQSSLSTTSPSLISGEDFNETSSYHLVHNESHISNELISNNENKNNQDKNKDFDGGNIINGDQYLNNINNQDNNNNNDDNDQVLLL